MHDESFGKSESEAGGPGAHPPSPTRAPWSQGTSGLQTGFSGQFLPQKGDGYSFTVLTQFFYSPKARCVSFPPVLCPFLAVTELVYVYLAFFPGLRSAVPNTADMPLFSLLARSEETFHSLLGELMIA